MATRMQQRRGTASQWTTANPILNAGEIGFESDNNRFKIGDGINHWDDLSYFSDNAALSDLIDGAPDLLNTLNELAAAIGDDPAFFTTVATNLSNHQSDTTNIHGITDTAELATKAFAASLLTGATKSNITITGDKNGLTITAENGVADSTTDNLTEGSTNKYFTDERAQDATGAMVSGNTETGISVTYDDAGNKLNFAVTDQFPSHSTTDLAEGTNLYYTDERAQDAVGLNVGTGLTYTDSTGEIKVNTTTIQARVANVSDTEIGYLDGVTSAIQTQMDAKAPLASPTFTGTVTLPSGTVTSTMIADGTIVTADIADSAVTSAKIANDTIVNADINSAAAIALSKLATDPLARANHTGSQTASTISDFNEAAQDAIGGILGTGLTYNDASNTITVDSTNIQLRVTGVTDTDIGYLDGVTSAIQTQMDAKLASSTAASTYAPLASPTFTGTVNAADLTLSGNLTVSGTTTTVNTTSFEVADPLVYLGTGNSANLVDLGFAGHFDNGTYQHTGLVRDASDGKWKLFSGVSTEPTTTIDFTGATYDTLKLGAGEATSATIGNVSNTELQYLDGVTSAVQTQLDSKLSSSTASSTYAPINAPTFTGTVSGITKSMVGLGNVENTALSTWAGSSNITTLGTIATGTWSATEIAVAKGGTGATSASAARTNLGATTVGANVFTLTNPSALSYVKVASDNTVSAASASTVKTDLSLNNVENTAVSTWAGSTNITTLGTVATGTWSATAIALNKGGTGATTQAGAANAVLPSQASANGKYLTSDGTNVSWGTVAGYSAPTLGSTSIGSGATVSTISALTLSGATLTGTLTANSSAGTSGQVLSSTGSGLQWITPSQGAAFNEFMLIGA